MYVRQKWLTLIFVLVFQLSLYFRGISGLSFFSVKPNLASLKTEILELSRAVDRGLSENDEQRTRLLELFEALERKNPNKNTLASKYTSGIWTLEYTTSDSILGRGDGFKRVGPILQTLDTTSLTAENSELVDYRLFKLPRKVSAQLVPMSSTKVEVLFKKFTIGPVKFNAPSTARGTLDITYIDEKLRLSRGDKGSIFVLSK